MIQRVRTEPMARDESDVDSRCQSAVLTESNWAITNVDRITTAMGYVNKICLVHASPHLHGQSVARKRNNEKYERYESLIDEHGFPQKKVLPSMLKCLSQF